MAFGMPNGEFQLVRAAEAWKQFARTRLRTLLLAKGCGPKPDPYHFKTNLKGSDINIQNQKLS
jgi:hypothetical protein